MGTILEIKLYGKEKNIHYTANLAVDEIKRIESVFSIFREGEAAKINQSSSIPFECSDEMWLLLKECEKYYEISEGHFDITIRPLMQLWGFYKKRNQIPSEEEISETLKKTGFSKLNLDENRKTISFQVEGMSLDFGGIAKGYAVDRAIAKIAENGVKSGFVNLGGNIRTLQDPPPKKNEYIIGIRHPTRNNDICGFAKIAKGRAMATSGNYERYLILEKKHITHIINPMDGKPVENMLSVTVIAPDAISADALSTSIFVGGVKLAKKVNRDNPQIEFLIIEKNDNGEIKIEKLGNSWSDIVL